MDSANKQKDSQIELQHVSNLLKDKMGIEIISKNLIFDQILHGKDNEQEYSLLIINLQIDERNDMINENKLNESIDLARQYQEISHPNILKYYKDFQIRNYYFILFESYDITLHDWIITNKGKPIQQDQFIKISLQILKSALYLNNNHYFLKDLSLKNILIDKNLTIKISKFGKPFLIENRFVKKSFEQKLESEDLFYLPPEFLKEEQQKYFINYDTDIWQIGICLYSLAGANNKDILDYIQDKKLFKIQDNLNYHLNSFLIHSLQKNPYYKRPSIPYSIKYLKNILNNNTQKLKIEFNQIQIEDKEQITNNNEELNLEGQFIKYLTQGIQKFNASLLEEALFSFKKCLEINQNNDIPYYYLSKIYLLKGNYQKAIEIGQYGLNINKKYDYILCQIGSAYFYQNKIDLSTKYYKLATEVNKINDFAYYNIATSYHGLQQLDKAIQFYELAISINPNNSDNYYNLGIIYHDLLNDDKSIENFKQSIKINHQEYESLNNLGSILLEKSKIQEAILYFKKAIKDNILDESYQNNLSKAFQQQNKYENSLRIIKKLLNITSKYKVYFQNELKQCKKQI